MDRMEREEREDSGEGDQTLPVIARKEHSYLGMLEYPKDQEEGHVPLVQGHADQVLYIAGS